MIRISMSLPKELMNKFDEVTKDRGYNSRSKGIRDALNDYIVRYQWMNEIEGNRTGIIAAICDNHFVGVMDELTTVQHDYRQYINSTMHILMSKKQCLEVIVVNGDADNIRGLTEKIMSIRGVEHVKLTSTGTKED